MNSTILTRTDEIQQIMSRIDQFADRIASPLPFHRMQVPLIWWKHFSSSGAIDFGSKRGRNFLGAKSWLRSPFFIVVEGGGEILGVAPLFISEVLLRGTKEPLKLLSFIPDSGLIFYQDFLVRPDVRQEVIASIFSCIEEIVTRNSLILFLGHIPEDSANFQDYCSEVSSRVARGWRGGWTVNNWRSGVYPWNIPKLCAALNASLGGSPTHDEELQARVKKLVAALESQTSALMLLKETRQRLEKEAADILRVYEERKVSSEMIRAISQVFETKPVIYPYKVLPRNGDDFYASLSSSKRYFYRRYMKKFLAAGGSFETIGPTKITAQDIDEYLNLHHARWGQESAALLPQTKKFHQELSLRMAEQGYFRLFFARYADKRIGVLSCFDAGKRREYYYSGRTLDAPDFRVGKLLVLHSILDAIERGYEIFDLGYGDNEYKFDFTNTHRTLRSFLLTADRELPDTDRLFPLYEEIRL